MTTYPGWQHVTIPADTEDGGTAPLTMTLYEPTVEGTDLLPGAVTITGGRVGWDGQLMVQLIVTGEDEYVIAPVGDA